MKLKFKKQTWQVQGRKALRDSFRDYDHDGVINMFDCAPRNRRKQGVQHIIDERHCQLCGHDVSKDMSKAYDFDGKPTCINCAAKIDNLATIEGLDK